MNEPSGLSELLRFPCPACQAPLTLPPEAAGAQGPCPQCGREIVGPDPVRGLLPQLVAAPPPVASEPPAVVERPVAEPESAPERQSLLEPETEIHAPPIEEPPREPVGWDQPMSPEGAEVPLHDILPDEADRKPQRGTLEPLVLPPPKRTGFWVACWSLLALLLVLAGVLVWTISGTLGKAAAELENELTSDAVPQEKEATPAPEAEAEPAGSPTDEALAEGEGQDPAESTSEAGTGTGTGTGSEAEGVPAEPDHLASEASGVLRAFLEAPDWEIRMGFVLPLERVRQAMRERAAAGDDGPIATTSIRQVESDEGLTVFNVATPAHPGGFPVALVDTEDGPKVDWESFIGFYDDHFRKFVEGPTGTSGIFYVLVSKEPPGPNDAEAHHVRFRLSVPMPGRDKVAWIRKDSTGLARLRSLFGGSLGYEEGEIDVMEGETGVPVLLALAKKPSGDGRTYIEIEDVVAVGWGPRSED